MNRRALLALAPLLASGCVAAPLPNILPSSDPVSPSAEIRDVRPANVIGEYHSRQAVEPKPWRQRNDEQAPKTGDAS
ncbi:MAG: hypothetical protein J0J15_22025 [Mesorhizobium sp.]|nr:hypothetical protein [Mesorhizobium sp.]